MLQTQRASWVRTVSSPLQEPRTWLALFALFFLLWACSGCLSKQQNSDLNLVNDWEIHKTKHFPSNDLLSIDPVLKATETVSTVLNPEENESRYITLQECIALALENGRTGEKFDNAGSYGTTSLSGLLKQADAGTASDSIRVFAYDPAIVGTLIEENLARFDARWLGSMTWNTIDQPVATVLEEIQAGSVGAITRQRADFSTSLIKPLPTGGLTGITFSTNYELSNLNPPFNPSYRPVVDFSFEQPLLRGNGIWINQLRGGHPGSELYPVSAQGSAIGILIARAFTDESQVEFDRRVQDLVFAVEKAYWELHYSYWNHYSREVALRQVSEAWNLTKRKFDTQEATIQSLTQVEEQLHRFRVDRLQALGNGSNGAGVQEAERKLRYVLGLPVSDGTRLVPIDEPTEAPFHPHLERSIRTALTKRAELIQVRQEIAVSQMILERDLNYVLPDLRFVSRYNINGLGNRLDGPEPGNALANLADNRYHDWTLGLRMEVPIGSRAAYSAVRRAKLQLAQKITYLRDLEEKLISSMTKIYRDIIQLNEELTIQKARRLAAGKHLEAQYKLFLAGGDPNLFLEAQRFWVQALLAERETILRYNLALADFRKQQGTILQHNNVEIVEGLPPPAVQHHASEHIRERSKAVLLRTRPKFEHFPTPLRSLLQANEAIRPRMEMPVSIEPVATIGAPHE